MRDAPLNVLEQKLNSSLLLLLLPGLPLISLKRLNDTQKAEELLTHRLYTPPSPISRSFVTLITE